MSKPNPKYSFAFKRKVFQLVMSGQESVISVSHRFGIGGSMTVYKWIKQFQDATLHQKTTLSMASSHIAKKKTTLSLLEQQQQDELEMLRLKVLAYETLIDVAEKELGISIKKKSSAKQSHDSDSSDQT
jgi:transposase-like protein